MVQQFENGMQAPLVATLFLIVRATAATAGCASLVLLKSVVVLIDRIVSQMHEQIVDV